MKIVIARHKILTKDIRPIYNYTVYNLLADADNCAGIIIGEYKYWSEVKACIDGIKYNRTDVEIQNNVTYSLEPYKTKAKTVTKHNEVV